MEELVAKEKIPVSKGIFLKKCNELCGEGVEGGGGGKVWGPGGGRRGGRGGGGEEEEEEEEEGE